MPLEITPVKKKQFEKEVLRDKVRYQFSFIDAVLNVAERWGIEPECAGALIADGTLKDKLKSDGQSIHLMPRPNTVKSRLQVI